MIKAKIWEDGFLRTTKNKFNGTDKNIVIYGHNMKDNSMFGTMQNILNPEWYNNEENTNIILKTERENYIYKVFFNI